MTYSYFSGENRVIINGKVIKDDIVQSEYDGKVLHVNKNYKNKTNKFKHYDLKNKAQIKRILEDPMSIIRMRLLHNRRTNKNKNKNKNKKYKKKTYKKKT